MPTRRAILRQSVRIGFGRTATAALEMRGDGDLDKPRPSSDLGEYSDSEQPTEALPTTELLRRVRSGQDGAVDAIYRRYLPRLQRWARRRLTPSVRGAMDTGDLVQEAVLRSVRHLDRFEPYHPGAFLDYLHQIVRNRVVDELRRIRRQPSGDETPGGVADSGPSPLERAIGQETLERYERALEKLSPSDRAAVIARLELGLTHAEVAQELEMSSADAARVKVRRALRRLAEHYAEESR